MSTENLSADWLQRLITWQHFHLDPRSNLPNTNRKSYHWQPLVCCSNNWKMPEIAFGTYWWIAGVDLVSWSGPQFRRPWGYSPQNFQRPVWDVGDASCQISRQSVTVKSRWRKTEKHTVNLVSHPYSVWRDNNGRKRVFGTPQSATALRTVYLATGMQTALVRWVANSQVNDLCLMLENSKVGIHRRPTWQRSACTDPKVKRSMPQSYQVRCRPGGVGGSAGRYDYFDV